jgi:hypothetical protein
MTRMAAGIWIDASPDRVLQVVGAPPGPLLPEGGPHLVLDGPPGQAGTRYRWEFQRLGLNFRVDSKLTECRPGQRLAFRGTAGWEMEAQVDCEPEAGGTRLLFRMRFRFGAPARWLIPGALTRLGVWHALRRVKAMTEAGGPVGAVSLER